MLVFLKNHLPLSCKDDLLKALMEFSTAIDKKSSHTFFLALSNRQRPLESRLAQNSLKDQGLWSSFVVKQYEVNEGN